MQALDMPIESYFDGRMFKNKIWVGTVEGVELFFYFQFENIFCLFCMS